MRKFEVAKGFEDCKVALPLRSTKGSAGYDFYALEDITIKPFYSKVIKMMNGHECSSGIDVQKEIKDYRLVTMVQTGVTAKMNDDEVLQLHIRSSLGKKGLMLANSTGIIDSDYSPNPIGIMFINTTSEPFEIKSGDKIAQGIFMKYLTTDDDKPLDVERTGGFGSTGE